MFCVWTAEVANTVWRSPVVQGASASTFDGLGSFFSFCLSPLTLSNPHQERNPHCSKARSSFWRWGGHRFSLKPQRQLTKGHQRATSTDSFTLAFNSRSTNSFLYPTARLQLRTPPNPGVKMSYILRPWSQNSLCRCWPRGELGRTISEVIWFYVSLQVVWSWCRWGNRVPEMGVALDGACKLGWYNKMGFVVYRRLKTNDLSEWGKSFLFTWYTENHFRSCLFRLQTKKPKTIR